MLETIAALLTLQLMALVGIYLKIKPPITSVVMTEASKPDPSGRACQLCYMEIPKKARRCPHCTSNLATYGD